METRNVLMSKFAEILDKVIKVAKWYEVTLHYNLQLPYEVNLTAKSIDEYDSTDDEIQERVLDYIGWNPKKITIEFESKKTDENETYEFVLDEGENTKEVFYLDRTDDVDDCVEELKEILNKHSIDEYNIKLTGELED